LDRWGELAEAGWNLQVVVSDSKRFDFPVAYMYKFYFSSHLRIKRQTTYLDHLVRRTGDFAHIAFFKCEETYCQFCLHVVSYPTVYCSRE